MQQGMGGYGRVNANFPVPVGGAATASQPVGAIIQRLLAMFAGNSGAGAPSGGMPGQGRNGSPDGFDRAMAQLLALDGARGQPQAAMPMPERKPAMEGWIGAAPKDMAATGQQMMPLVTPDQEGMQMGISPEELELMRRRYQQEMQRIPPPGM